MKAFFTALTAVALASTSSWAGDDPAKQNKSNTGDSQTICGTVSAVSVEGETLFDYRTKNAVTLEASFLTIVGSPKASSDKHDQKSAKNDRSSDSSDKNRDNVYMAWLSPKTKVFQCSDADHPDKKTETSLDKLEIGDRVEVVFVPSDSTADRNWQHQTDSMSKKHGRHRTKVGTANEIWIMPCKEHKESPAGK